MGKQLATEMAPPFNLVAHFMIAGAFFYMFASFALPFYAGELSGFFVSSKLAALLHLYLLGFVMMIIFGAMYQLVPVILEIPLFSKDFAYIQFYLYVVGLLLMVYGFGVEGAIDVLPYGAMLVYASMLIFSVNILLTYRNIETWNISAKYIFVSNIFLLIAVTLGLVAAFNLVYGFLETDMLRIVNAHMAGVLTGYVMMTVMGVSIVLLPMFSLAHGFDERPVTAGFYVVTFGTAAYMAGALAGSSTLQSVGTAGMIAALLLFIWQVWIIFKKRVRKQNDYWAKNVIASFLFFVISLIAFAAAYMTGNTQVGMFGGYLFFFGFLAFLIVGHIYKILPFLVWYQRYSPLVGKQKVPMLHEMVVGKIADGQFWVTFAGTVVSAAGILFASAFLFITGTVVMAVSVFLVLYNIYYTLTYRK